MHATLLAGLILSAAPPPRADTPRAIVHRAIQVSGIESLRKYRPAQHQKVQMKINLGAPGGAEINGEVRIQAGGKAMRADLALTVAGLANAKLIQVDNGNKSWASMNGMVVPGETAEQRKVSRHVDRVSALVALLEDNKFTLETLPDERLNGKEVRRVKVSYPDQPPITLSFDRGSGLLVQHVHRPAGPAAGMTDSVTTLTEYRRIGGGTAEEEYLRSVEIGTTDRELLVFLQNRKNDPAALKKIRLLIQKLGDDDFEVRERAEKDLRAIGSPALPALNEALKNPDLEIVIRARRLIAAIGREKLVDRTAAAVRLLAHRAPAGAAEALLQLLPADEKVTEDIYAALAWLAQKDGKSNPALLKALKDPDPSRRRAAEAVLGKDGGRYLNKPGRRLFLPARRLATRMSIRQGTQPAVTLEYKAVEYLNRFEDRIFDRP